MTRAARATIADPSCTAQGSPSVRRSEAEDAPRVLANLDEDALVVLGFLREALDDTGWTQDALAAWFTEHRVRSADRQYVGKMLTGEKPITLRDVVAFPDDLEAAFLRLWTAKFGPTQQEVMGRLLCAMGEVMSVCQLGRLPLRIHQSLKAELK